MRAASPYFGTVTGRFRSPRPIRRLSRNSRSSGRCTVVTSRATARAPSTSRAADAAIQKKESTAAERSSATPTNERTVRPRAVASVPTPGCEPVSFA